MIVYHNSKCSKSRSAIDFLREKGVVFLVVEYLKTPLNKEELKNIVAKLGIDPLDLIRKGEMEFKENFKNKSLTNNEWLDAMVKFPKLIERPIVLTDAKAIVARPTERINELF
jgi:arsenate reductase